MKDRVVFRKFKDNGKVIALFPNLPAHPGRVMSYMHMGQHSEADYPFIISVTEPAYHPETKDLQEELMSIGYDVQIGSRIYKRKQERSD